MNPGNSVLNVYHGFATTAARAMPEQVNFNQQVGPRPQQSSGSPTIEADPGLGGSAYTQPMGTINPDTVDTGGPR